jgi:pyruvate/2-oxoglutarate dehydrogenase complex dihydrolipoamide acyltransferase (E2) component
MPNDKQAPKELKVTDKRIFTADGEIRDEFKDLKPAEPQPAKAAEPPVSKPEEAARPAEAPRPEPKKPAAEERRRRPADAEQGENPATPFALFAEQLIAQAYMALGMLRNPYQPQPKVDAAAARQMIDILQMLQEKTQGNLTPEEEDFLNMHLGELKLAFVQRTKSI